MKGGRLNSFPLPQNPHRHDSEGIFFNLASVRTKNGKGNRGASLPSEGGDEAPHERGSDVRALLPPWELPASSTSEPPLVKTFIWKHFQTSQKAVRMRVAHRDPTQLSPRFSCHHLHLPLACVLIPAAQTHTVFSEALGSELHASGPLPRELQCAFPESRVCSLS